MTKPTKEQIAAGVAVMRDWDFGRDGGLYALIPVVYRAMEAAKLKTTRLEEQLTDPAEGSEPPDLTS